MKALLSALLLVTGIAQAAEKNPALIDMDLPARPAPAVLEYDSYVEWVRPLLVTKGKDSFSAFTPYVFEWYKEESQRSTLPADVYNDPGKIFVSFDRPIRQTDELEGAGEIEVGNTVGAEVYAEFEATLDQALDAMLFTWGKPVGKNEGKTFPAPSPFGRRVDYFSPLAQLGAGAYANLTLRRDGGIVKDIADRYVLLVRGDKVNGYTVVMQFIKPALNSPSQQCIAIAILRPLPGGKISYRISTRFQGQNYKMLGNVSIGRSQIGFNRGKVRAIAEEYGKRIKELRETGKISEKPTNIEWGK
jgi:hypothetical protein